MAIYKQLRRRINYLHVWVVRAANRKKITETCSRHLIGLNFDHVYTPDLSLCMETVSQICLILELKEVEITLTERFRDQKNPIECWETFRVETGFKAGVAEWQKQNPKEFKELLKKSKIALQDTVKGLAARFANRLSFNILVVVDDSTPMFEIIGLPVNHDLTMMYPGQVTRISFEISGDDTYQSSKITPKMAVQLL